MKSDSQDLLAVACVRKPHGVKGLIKIHSFSGDFDHIAAVDEVRVSLNGGIRTFSIENKVRKGGELLLKLAGVDTPEAVKAMAGADILLPRSQVKPCSKDEFFIADLVGCSLIFEGEDCGKVISVVTNAPQHLLEVEKADGKRSLIPMSKEAVGEIDLKNKTIELLESWFLQ